MIRTKEIGKKWDYHLNNHVEVSTFISFGHIPVQGKITSSTQVQENHTKMCVRFLLPFLQL